MRHLQPGPLKPTLHVEPLIRLRAIQYRLVAPHLLRHKVQGLDNPQAQLFALLVLCDSDVFNVPNEPKVVDEFAFSEQGAGADDLLGGVEDAE